MASRELMELIERAQQLPLDEQLELMTFLEQAAQRTAQGSTHRRKWSELAGAAPYGLFGEGEDDQVVVSRMRQEWDEHRSALIGLPPATASASAATTNSDEAQP